MREVCIRIEDDGSMSVGLEPQAEESAEPEMGMKDDSYLEPVADERELMMKLREILSQVKGESDSSSEDAFQSGFKSASGGM